MYANYHGYFMDEKVKSQRYISVYKEPFRDSVLLPVYSNTLLFLRVDAHLSSHLDVSAWCYGLYFLT